MRLVILLAVAFVLLPVAFACDDLVDGQVITKDTQLCSETYDVPSGITITGDDIQIDCRTAVLRGTVDQSEIGIRIENASKVKLHRCNVVTFDQGLYLKNVTHSHIFDNAFLKNRIGVRMLDSFENVLEKNSDKSHQLAVSAINSKYNVVMLGNKNVERSFCDVNACNKAVEMDPCEAGDFYCSVNCDAESDADCAPVMVPQTVSLKEPETLLTIKRPPSAAVVIAKNESGANESLERVPRELSLLSQSVVYLVLYLVAFLGLHVFKHRKSRVRDWGDG